jgi:RNAse (barnase) inhibitor barstar
MPETSYFVFAEAVESIPNDHVAYLRGTIGTKQELLNALANALSFPEYFGHNWDALLDSLRDLSWLPARRIVIQHEFLPALKDGELRTYLEVLIDAIEHWRALSKRELLAVFPPDARERVAQVLSPRLSGQVK